LYPVINEGAKLTKLLHPMNTMDLGLGVIIAAGGSTDSSNDSELLKGLNVRTLSIKTGPVKLSAQMRMFSLMPWKKATPVPLDRKIGLKLLHALVVSLAAGFRYTDTTNGFGGFSSRFLLDPRVQSFRDVFDIYDLHYYLAIKAATKAAIPIGSGAL
jgi:dolichol-phosphate mannosyltransferase